MPRKKRESSTIVRKTLLPIIDLSEDSNTTPSVTTGETSERHHDNDDFLPNSDDYSLNEDYSNDEYNDSMAHFNNKRKNKDLEKESDTQKKIRFTSTLSDLQNVQNQLVTIVQDMHKKVNEMYADWKAIGFGGHSESDTKWLEDTINQAISAASEKIKYPSEERLMTICYDALSAANHEEFQKKIKHGGWKRFYNKHIRSLAQRLSRQARSNIVQRIKDAIHMEFSDLTKPKTQNRQVTNDEERKFKNSVITRECYMKLNKPVNADDDPHYTYLNLIIDHVFTNSKTEKNSIAFGMAVALNYLDPSKGVNMVPSEVVERMNSFLDKMQVSDHEEL